MALLMKQLLYTEGFILPRSEGAWGWRGGITVEVLGPRYGTTFTNSNEGVYSLTLLFTCQAKDA